VFGKLLHGNGFSNGKRYRFEFPFIIRNMRNMSARNRKAINLFPFLVKPDFLRFFGNFRVIEASITLCC
jgi:hypothetical protein